MKQLLAIIALLTLTTLTSCRHEDAAPVKPPQTVYVYAETVNQDGITVSKTNPMQVKDVSSDQAVQVTFNIDNVDTKDVFRIWVSYDLGRTYTLVTTKQPVDNQTLYTYKIGV